MVRLLKSGRLPPERIGSVLKLACERGNEQDLAFVYEQAVKPDGFPPELRRQALEGLAAAAETRKVRPQVSGEGLLALLDDRDPGTARAAVRLAAAWKLPALAPPLRERVLDAKTSEEARRLALDALLAIGGPSAHDTTDKLLASDIPRLRAYGVAASPGMICRRPRSGPRSCCATRPWRRMSTCCWMRFSIGRVEPTSWPRHWPASTCRPIARSLRCDTCTWPDAATRNWQKF